MHCIRKGRAIFLEGWQVGRQGPFLHGALHRASYGADVRAGVGGVGGGGGRHLFVTRGRGNSTRFNRE